MRRAAGARSASRQGRELQIAGQIRMRPAPAPRQGLHQEEPAEDFKSSRAKGWSKLAGGMQKQLRFNAVNVRRVQKQFEKMLQQRIFLGAHGAGCFPFAAFSPASGRANTSPITRLWFPRRHRKRSR